MKKSDRTANEVMAAGATILISTGLAMLHQWELAATVASLGTAGLLVMVIRG
jgi:hypothetical protein